MEEKSWVGDLIKIQASLPKIKKDSKNPHFGNKYASLDELMEKLLPVITKNNFSWITLPGYDPETGEPIMSYNLLHKSGEGVSGSMKLLQARPDPQGQGSAITYARRYALMSVLGVVADEDDDGNAASTHKEPAKSINHITPKQVALLYKWAKEHGAEDRDAAAKLINLKADTEDFTQMSTKEASALIKTVLEESHAE